MLSGYICTQYVLNVLIYPYYREKIEGKLEEILKRYKKIGIKIEKKRSIMIDKSRYKDLNLDHYRSERRTTFVKIDYKLPERRKSGLKQESKIERRQSNSNLSKAVKYCSIR